MSCSETCALALGELGTLVHGEWRPAVGEVPIEHWRSSDLSWMRSSNTSRKGRPFGPILQLACTGTTFASHSAVSRDSRWPAQGLRDEIDTSDEDQRNADLDWQGRHRNGYQRAQSKNCKRVLDPKLKREASHEEVAVCFYVLCFLDLCAGWLCRCQASAGQRSADRAGNTDAHGQLQRPLPGFARQR